MFSFRSTNYQLKNKLNMETKISNEVENGNLQQGTVRSSFNYEAAWKLLEEKGLNVGERMKIRKAFSDWGKGFDENIEHDHKHNTYSSKKKKGDLCNIKFFQPDKKAGTMGYHAC